ncbi:hypothetical protein ACFOED_01640 [Vulcaniibacterium thermophilum]|uniref:hypothetical protein n=1 Tax=Vulcaniibacterium thermophilum TaxID=1169913 RepID=UPI0011B796E8|nr:hypothetical protein [Vulcaniibacterium thermophilum]
MKHSSAPFVLALLLWVTPVQAAKCPLYSYIAQPGQDPVGLLKLEASSEDALRSQIPGAPSGKLCWYTSPEGLLFAEPPKGNKRYIFRRTEGRWSFSETQN